MIQKIENITHKTTLDADIYKPQFFRLSNLDDEKKLSELLDTEKSLRVYDEMLGQLQELVKSKNPKIRFTSEALKNSAIKYVGETPFEKYGVWVYFPWSSKLVHILDEEEFVQVRTNRNHYKITPDEEEKLSSKKIGVIGLSVGKAIAMTIAMERICGELRLADFDVIELSNLNRIQTGVHNFGIKKTIVVAREIAEIDPYFKVSLFSDGLTENNVEDFFLENGKLDVCIEVCDGLYTKIFARQKAKALKIPVVMNSSDRGTTDIERYDLHPELPILHGLIDHLDLNLVKQAKTNEEKVPYLLPMLGLETSTTRLKASMLEIEETITTWPQLASGVVLGGAICTDVCRRILLDELKDSGRFLVDLDDLIDNKKLAVEGSENTLVISKSLSDSEMQSIASSLLKVIDQDYVMPTQYQIESLVSAATKAPSGGNSQPWKWYYTKGNLFLFHDISRSQSLLDFENMASYISLGAATENLVLKSYSLGLNPEVLSFPLLTDRRLVCQFLFLKKSKNPDPQFDHLVSEIESRLTNRTLQPRQTIDAKLLHALQQSAQSVAGAQMKVVDSMEQIEKLANVIAAVERIRIMHVRGHSDFVNEVRWCDEEAEAKRDGIDLNTIDISPTEHAGLLVSKNWSVINTLKVWKKGRALENMVRKATLSSSALCLITMPNHSPINHFNGGRALQRAWLSANKMNISIQPLSPATFLFTRLEKGDGIELDVEMKTELTKLKNDFDDVMDWDSKDVSVFLFRLCIAERPKVRALRKKLTDVLIYE